MASITTPFRPTSPTRRRLTTAQIKAVEAVADLYCATPSDIARWLRGTEPQDTYVRSVRYSLQSLMANPRTPYLRKYRFGTTSLYGLSQAGAAFTRHRGVAEARHFGIRDFEHEHILTLIHIALREFCVAHGFRLQWQQPLLDFSKQINPDAIVTVTTAKGAYTFCIEVERQSFSENHLKKAKKYHDVFGTPEALTLIGAEKFYAVFATETYRKATTVLEKLGAQYPYRMFWVTTSELLATKLDAAIFRTPKDYKTTSYSLLDL
jgi:hypothetical protein